MNKMKFIPVIFAVFLPTIVMADDLYTSDIVNGCGDAYYYKAILEPISYTCSNGQYLPAGAVSCEVCPNTHTCNGGTYTFDANHTQGLSDGDILITDAIGSCSTQFNQNFSAIFEPITYTCTPGYYLPANIDECTACPAHTVCAGGTYTFNETTTQGITGCESGYNLQNNVCVGNIITIDWSDALAEDISANNAGTMTYGGDIRTPRAAIDKTNIGLRFKGWVFNKPIP